jgi:hypothetical protein
MNKLEAFNLWAFQKKGHSCKLKIDNMETSIYYIKCCIELLYQISGLVQCYCPRIDIRQTSYEMSHVTRTLTLIQWIYCAVNGAANYV